MSCGRTRWGGFVADLLRALPPASDTTLPSCTGHGDIIGCGSCGAGYCTTDCSEDPAGVPFCINLNAISEKPEPCHSDADCIAVKPSTPYCVAAFGYPNSCSGGTYCAALCR